MTNKDSKVINLLLILIGNRYLYSLTTNPLSFMLLKWHDGSGKLMYTFYDDNSV